MKDKIAREFGVENRRIINKLTAEIETIQHKLDFINMREFIGFSPNQLLAEFSELNKRVAELHIADEPAVRLRAPAGMGYLDTINISMSTFAQMLLDHLNLKVVDEHLTLKEVVDNDNAKD